MMKKDCFAYKDGECKALKVKKCEGESCSFYKTKAQVEEGQKRVFRRINALHPIVKMKIMDRYYSGRWADECEEIFITSVLA